MKIYTYNAIAAMLLLASVNLYSEPHTVGTPGLKQDAATIHGYYDFYNTGYKVSKQARAYYKAMQMKHLSGAKELSERPLKRLANTPKDIFHGLHLTIQAVDALHDDNIVSAEQTLAKANSLFEKTFKAHPEFKMVPVDVDIVIEDHNITNKNIHAITENAIRMLKEHNAQKAIALLGDLKNQINITTLYLPLAFYETGMKDAYAALKKGDKEEAMDALETSFDSMIVQESVIPIDLLKSHHAVFTASKINKNNRREITRLLDIAQDHLEQAQLLGYTSKYSAEYKNLSAQIVSLKEAMKEEKGVDPIYDTLKRDYNTLLDSIVGEIPLIGS